MSIRVPYRSPRFPNPPYPYDSQMVGDGVDFYWGLGGILSSPNANIGVGAAVNLTATTVTGAPTEQAYITAQTRDAKSIFCNTGPADVKFVAPVAVDGTFNFTIGLWVNISTAPGGGWGLFSTDNDNTSTVQHGISLIVNPDRSLTITLGSGHVTGFYPATYQQSSPAGGITLATRTFVVLTVQPSATPTGNIVNLYLNGAFYYQPTWSDVLLDVVSWAETNLVFGDFKILAVTMPHPNGYSDSPFLIKRLLTPQEINTLYLLGSV